MAILVLRMALLEGPPVIAEDLFKVSRSIRCLVGAIEHGWTTSSHPDPPGYASSDSLLFVFPGGREEEGMLKKEILIRSRYSGVCSCILLKSPMAPEGGRDGIEE